MGRRRWRSGSSPRWCGSGIWWRRHIFGFKSAHRTRGTAFAPVVSHPIRSQPKPPWVARELIRLKAWSPELGCRVIAEVFNRQFADRRVTFGKTYVATVLRRSHSEVIRLRRTLKHRVPRPVPEPHLGLGSDRQSESDQSATPDPGAARSWRACLLAVECTQRQAQRDHSARADPGLPSVRGAGTHSGRQRGLLQFQIIESSLGTTECPPADDSTALPMAERAHRTILRHVQTPLETDRVTRQSRSGHEADRIPCLVQPCAAASTSSGPDAGRGMGRSR